MIHDGDEVEFKDDAERDAFRRFFTAAEKQLVDPRDVDWRAGEPPATMADRRMKLTEFNQKWDRAYRAAFSTYLRQGKRYLTDEMRAQSTTTSGGGFLIQAAYEKQFIEMMKAYDPILDISTNFTTPTGAAGDFPVDDDVLSGRIVAESGAATETDATFGALPLVKCPKHGSDMLRVPLELLQDAFTTFDTLIAPVCARRLARSVAATAITRLLADADVAVTSAATGAVVATEILDLMGAVDPAHSRVGVFLLSEATLTSLKKLTAYTAGNFPNMIGTDSQGRATIFGKTAYSSPSMPALGAGNKSIAFGNFSRFYIRTVAGSLVLQRYDERYAEYFQAGFQMFWRAQGAMAKSTNNPVPIRLLACHA